MCVAKISQSLFWKRKLGTSFTFYTWIFFINDNFI